MEDADFTDDFCRFIQQTIPSVEAAELLIHLSHHPEQSLTPAAAVAGLPAGSHVLVMSFSHAEDLDIVAACLQRLRVRNDLGFVGLIGSRTKWATFRHRLAERGFDDALLARITCPIGLPGISGKEPAVIAAAVAAQLLLVESAVPAGSLAQA